MKLWTHCTVATMQPDTAVPYGLIEDATLVVEGGCCGGSAHALICRLSWPRVASSGTTLVDAVDAFCEHIGFSVAQTRRVFEAARQLGVAVKLHAEQLSDSGGAELAASFSALSCDHLEWLSEAGAQAMARAGSVAVLLPGAFYFLRDRGVLAAGLRADFVLWDVQRPAQLSYALGANPCRQTVIQGETR